jgi:hypothetical protein
MKRFLVFLSVVCILISLFSVTATAREESRAFAGGTSALAGSTLEINIKVSPNVIAIVSVGALLSVHTDIALSLVDTSSLTLNGVAVAWTKADAKGNLVAKFDLAEIKAIVECPEATLQLVGLTKDGTEFTGSDTVAVH